MAGVGVAVATVVVVVVLAGGEGDEGRDVASGGTGATDIAMEDFNGQVVRLSDLEGRPAVVNFWASWCIPCQAEMPGFEQVYQRHRDTVAFLGINLADDPGSALEVVARTGVTYPLARDPQAEVFGAFGGIGMPTTVFLDAEGGIVELRTGEISAAELETRLVDYFES